MGLLLRACALNLIKIRTSIKPGNPAFGKVYCQIKSKLLHVIRVGSTSHRQKDMRAYFFRRTFVASDADSDTAVALRQ
jgi:hypothetical protein